MGQGLDLKRPQDIPLLQFREDIILVLRDHGNGGLLVHRVEQLPEPCGAPAQPQIAEQRFHTGGPAVIRYFGVFRRMGGVGIASSLEDSQLLLGEQRFQHFIGLGLCPGTDHADCHAVQLPGGNGGHCQLLPGQQS